MKQSHFELRIEVPVKFSIKFHEILWKLRSSGIFIIWTNSISTLQENTNTSDGNECLNCFKDSISYRVCHDLVTNYIFRHGISQVASYPITLINFQFDAFTEIFIHNPSLSIANVLEGSLNIFSICIQVSAPMDHYSEGTWFVDFPGLLHSFMWLSCNLPLCWFTELPMFLHRQLAWEIDRRNGQSCVGIQMTPPYIWNWVYISEYY